MISIGVFSMINPKVSVITPALNSEKTISACIESVASQSYKNLEHLIIDGVSEDSTLDIIRSYQLKYPHIKYISEKDTGIYNAMNKGLRICSGDWVYFLGSDDTFFNSDILEIIFSEKDYTSCYMLYGNVLFKNSGVIYNGKYSSLKLIRNNICHQAIFFYRDVFSKIGNFDETYRLYADWVFNMKFFNCNLKCSYLDLIIAVFDEGGASSTLHDLTFQRDRKILEKEYFSLYIVYMAIVKDCLIGLKNKIVKIKKIYFKNPVFKNIINYKK